VIASEQLCVTVQPSPRSGLRPSTSRPRHVAFGEPGGALSNTPRREDDEATAHAPGIGRVASLNRAPPTTGRAKARRGRGGRKGGMDAARGASRPAPDDTRLVAEQLRGTRLEVVDAVEHGRRWQLGEWSRAQAQQQRVDARHRWPRGWYQPGCSAGLRLRALARSGGGRGSWDWRRRGHRWHGGGQGSGERRRGGRRGAELERKQDVPAERGLCKERERERERETETETETERADGHASPATTGAVDIGGVCAYAGTLE